MKSLSADGTLQPLHPDACKCGLKCHLGVQVADVIAHRVEILHVVPATEVGCSTYLATSIRMSLANTQGSTPYTWQGKKVCREFFAMVSGVSVNKMPIPRLVLLLRHWQGHRPAVQKVQNTTTRILFGTFF